MKQAKSISEVKYRISFVLRDSIVVVYITYSHSSLIWSHPLSSFPSGLQEGKVAVRNVRRDSVDKIKAAEKDKSISKDDSKDFQDDLQTVTDDFIKKLDTMLKNKEKDLLKI